MSVKIIRRPNEPLGLLVKRLKRVLQKTGVYKELRAHSHYIKPSEKRRQKERRKKFNTKYLKQE